MTTFMDLMGLAKRAHARGETDLAGQISVLALDSFEDTLLDGGQPDPQGDADQDALEEKPLLEALEDGTEDGGAESYVGQKGEVPVATVLELAAITKTIRAIGHTKQARALNQIIENLTRGYA